MTPRSRFRVRLGLYQLLLDTDTCIYAIKEDASVLRRLLSESRADIAVSVITEGELRTGGRADGRTGAAKSSNADKTRRRVEKFLGPLSILEFTSEDAASYAQIRARLERARTPIGPLDTLIAAQVVLRKLTLVTNNQREFSRIPGLRVENWSAD